ncbi:MAG: hypothetical protein RBU29_04130 [bacterium]|jgi:hypothetical protein|nr:hypothetical protein [bacterium]
MTDFFIPIPPPNIGAIEPSKKPDSAPPAQAEGSVSFQETLKKTLGQIKQEADQVAEAAPPSYEEMDQVMNAAKNAFADTMQAHQMMQMIFQQNRTEPPKR